jgi:hypothetical protein
MNIFKINLEKKLGTQSKIFMIDRVRKNSETIINIEKECPKKPEVLNSVPFDFELTISSPKIYIKDITNYIAEEDSNKNFDRVMSFGKYYTRFVINSSNKMMQIVYYGDESVFIKLDHFRFGVKELLLTKATSPYSIALN